MKGLLVPLVAAAALGSGCGPSTAESELLERIASLRAAGQLPAGEGEDAPGVRDFFGRFHALHARIEAGAFPAEDRAALDDFQRAAAELLDREVCREALRSGESLARPLVNTPRLLVLREWTDRLDARARLAAGEADRPAATESLRTAFELLSVLDDGSLIGQVVRLCQEQELIETVREIAPAVDAVALRAALAPHLRARSRAALNTTVALETSRFLRAVESVIEAGARMSPEDMEVLGFADVGFVAGAHRLIGRFEAVLAADEPCPSRLGTPAEESAQGARLLYAVSEWHAHNVRLELARVALAVEAYRQTRGTWPAELGQLDGGPPEPPCACLGYEYAPSEPGATGFRLTAVDRRPVEEDGTRAARAWPPGLDRR